MRSASFLQAQTAVHRETLRKGPRHHIKGKSKLRELEIKGEVEGASLALTESCCK